MQGLKFYKDYRLHCSNISVHAKQLIDFQNYANGENKVQPRSIATEIENILFYETTGENYQHKVRKS